mgnify:CR=1 FL=1
MTSASIPFWGRAKQFFRSLTASPLKDSDLKYIQRYLSEQERALFFQMDIIDQRHALEAARYAHRAATARGLGHQRHLIVKAALLHDIGKVKGDLPLLARAKYTLFQPKPGKNQNKAWAALKDHAQRGAHMAETFGTEPEVVRLIRGHHNPPQDEAAQVLQEADNLY